MIDCPACDGPVETRKTCATCNGELLISQEVFDDFMEKQAVVQREINFWMAIQQRAYTGGTFRFEADGEVFEFSK